MGVAAVSVKATLTHKVGPLPLYAWVLIAGATIAGVIYIQRQRAGTSTDGSNVDTGASDLGIDPTTGAPYASEFGTGTGASSSTTPTLTQEVSDVTGLVGELQAAGLIPTTAATTNASGQSGLIDLAPGHTYYDPLTGETVSGPEQAAAAQASGTVSAAGGTVKSAVDKAAAVVSSGKIGPKNRKTLNDAGYTNAQIDYHLTHKTPLGQPDGAAKVHQEAEKAASKAGVKAAQQKSTTAVDHAAASHPNQHVTAAAPNHSTPPTPEERWNAAHHSITYAQHVKDLAKK